MSFVSTARGRHPCNQHRFCRIANYLCAGCLEGWHAIMKYKSPLRILADKFLTPTTAGDLSEESSHQFRADGRARLPSLPGEPLFLAEMWLRGCLSRFQPADFSMQGRMLSMATKAGFISSPSGCRTGLVLRSACRFTDCHIRLVLRLADGTITFREMTYVSTRSRRQAKQVVYHVHLIHLFQNALLIQFVSCWIKRVELPVVICIQANLFSCQYKLCDAKCAIWNQTGPQISFKPSAP